VKSVALQQVMVEIASDFIELIFLNCGKIISSPTKGFLILRCRGGYYPPAYKLQFSDILQNEAFALQQK